MKKSLSILLLFIIFTAFFVVFGNQSWFSFEELHAQQLASSNTEELLLLDRRVDTFFRELAQSSSQTATEAAFEEIFQDGSSTQRTSSETVGSTSKKFIELSTLEIGRLHTNEKIGTKPIGRDVILLKYLTKHDIAPLAWSFTFYRSPRNSSTTSTTPVASSGDWDLVLVRFGTDLEDLL